MFFSWSIPYDITRNWQLFFIYFSRFIFIHHFHRLLGKKNIFLKNRLKPTANDNSKKTQSLLLFHLNFLHSKLQSKENVPKLETFFFLLLLFIYLFFSLFSFENWCSPLSFADHSIASGDHFFFLFFLISWYVFPVYFFTSFFCCCW